MRRRQHPFLQRGRKHQRSRPHHGLHWRYWRHGAWQCTDYLEVNTNVIGLITDCTRDSGAIAGVPGSAAMCREELFYNADVKTNVVGLITDCAGDFDAIAGVHGSAAMGGDCNSVSSSGNLQEKGTLPMDKETFTENIPSDAKSGCEFEGKHEQSIFSVSQGYNLCRDDTDPCGFAEKCQKICGSCTETSLPIPSSTSPHAQSSSPSAGSHSVTIERHR